MRERIMYYVGCLVKRCTTRETEDEERLFSDDVKDILKMSRLSGALPIMRRESGDWQFRPSLVVYALLIYVIVTPLIYMKIHNMTELFKQSTDFDEKLLLVMYINMHCWSFVIPFTSSWDAARVATYLNNWNNFQKLYFQTTLKHLQLNLTKRILISKVHLRTVIFLGFLGTQFLKPSSSLLQGLAVTMANTAHGCTIVLCWLFCSAVSDAGEQLLTSFVKEVAHQPQNSLATIYKWKLLWLSLSELTSQTGHALYATIAIVFISMIANATLALYGLSVNITMANYAQFLLFAGTFVFSLLPVFICCHEAHGASKKVTDNTRQTLLQRDTLNMDNDTKREVISFVDIIEHNTPRITLGGYCDINREMFHSACSTIVTYLVVILQFRVTLKQ